MFYKNKKNASKILVAFLSISAVFGLTMFFSKKLYSKNSENRVAVKNIVLKDKAREEIIPNKIEGVKSGKLPKNSLSATPKIIYEDLLFKSIKELSKKDFKDIYSFEDKARSSFDDRNKSIIVKKKILNQIKKNIDTEHQSQIDKILNNEFISFESLDSSMKISFNLNNVKSIIIDGFKTKSEAQEYKLFKDIERKIGGASFTRVLTSETSTQTANKINNSKNKINTFINYSGIDLRGIKNIQKVKIHAEPKGTEVYITISVGNKEKENKIFFKLVGF